MRLHGHTTELHAHTPMPKEPRAQLHFSQTAGDGRWAIHQAAGHFFDANVTYAAKLIDEVDGELGTNLLAHYAYPYLNGYRRFPGGKKVPLRRRHWSYDKWGHEGLTLVRRNGQHTLTLRQGLQICAEVGAGPIKETKSRAFATMDRPWKLINRDCEAYDVPNWCKTLVTMWGFKGKVVHAAKNGVPLVGIWGKKVRGRIRRLTKTRVVQRGWRDGTQVYGTW